MKQLNIKFLLALLISMLGVKASAHDIAVKNADGVTIYYVYNNNNTELAVSYRGSFGSNYSNEYAGNVVIPESVTYNGTTYPVTSIGDYAFYECSGLTSITIPNSVTSIGNYTFQYCSGLTSITIPNSVTSIDEGAFSNCIGLTEVNYNATNCTTMGSSGYPVFYGCSSLSTVNIGDNVQNIPSYAFYGCSGLTNITIPNSVTSIGYYAFHNTSWYDNQPDGLVYAGKVAYTYKGTMPSNTDIVLKEGTSEISDYAFSGCSGLTSITIPNSVTSIGGSAFSSCSGLTSITIPNSVTSIGSWAFYGCSGLTSVTIPNSVTSIGWSAFYNCSSLTSINIPNSVTNIEQYTFYGCSSLTSIDIPNSVTSIGYYAFESCSGLTSLTIPSSVTSIGGNAFYNCSKLTAVYISDLSAWCKIAFTDNNSNPLYYAHHLYLNNEEIKDLVIPDDITSIGTYTFQNGSGFTSLQIPNHITTIGESTFQGCSGLKTVVLPNQLRIIKANAFKGCSKLESLNIPATVEYIYQSAFADCSSLQSVTAQPTTPPFLYDNSFSNYAIPLNVPSGCKTAYQSAQGWKNFTTINDGNVYYQMSIESQGRGKVSYGTTEVTNGQKTVDVKEGTDAVLTLTADNGYQVASVTVNGEDKTAYVVNGQLTISNMSANTTVTVSFGVAGEFAKVVIGSDRMATFCPLADADFSTLNLKAYIGSGFNRQTGVLTLTRVKDVPAGEGLLLKGDPGTYFVPYSQSYSVYSNLLKGVTTETNLAATTGGYANYVLASGSNGTGFYRVPTEGTTLAAGRAYLSIPAETAASRSALRLAFDDEDEATGISASLTNNEERIVNGAVYDLQGRRVEQPQPGLYIRNGKKVIIK